MRPGFLGNLDDFWFGELYKPETAVEWYKEFWVDEPYWEKYWSD